MQEQTSSLAAHPARLLSLERQVRWLRAYAVLSGVAFVALLTAAFRGGPPDQPRAARFTEIEAERINVVSPSGRYAVVVANAERMPGHIMGGRERAQGRRGAGLLFYNADGDEAGGLLFDNARPSGPGGDTTGFAWGQLSLDRFKSDQVARLVYAEDRGGWNAGLQVSHFPRGSLSEWHRLRDSLDRLPAAARDTAVTTLQQRLRREGKGEIPRVFIGEQGRTATLNLRDTHGRQRLRLVVDSLDVARIEFLDERGAVVRRIPE